MQLLKFDLSTDQASQLVRGIAEAQYNLLLGAGFSMSAKDKHGKNLPSGPGLGVEINDAFNLGFSAQDARNLAVVFEEARHIADGEAKLAQFLRSRFVGATPTWHGEVLDFPWSRIWTLNIDDLFERTSMSDHVFKANPLSWTANLVPSTLGDHSVQVVHLHGRASTLDATTESLVFTLREYAKALRSQGDWHAEFWSQWLQRPFLVIGARLVEEIDLVEAITRGNASLASTGFPTIAVIKGVQDIDRRRLVRGGVVPIDADAEQFFLALQHDVDEYRAQFDEMTRTPMSAGAVARFNQQFEVLADGRQRVPSAHDFYGGDEPMWADIADVLDSQRQVTSSAIRALKAAAAGNKSGAILFTGAAGAGKTTALLRLAREFIPIGFRIFRFRETERPDVEAVLNWLGSNPKTLLVFDNAADFSGSIRELLDASRKVNGQCLIVIAERKKRASILSEDLGAYLIGSYEVGPVNRPDALSISRKRDAVGRLGIATGWDDIHLWNYFKKQNSEDLFMALSGLEQGRGFYSRLDKEWAAAIALAKPGQVKVLRAISLVHRLGYSLPFNVALDLSKQSNIADLGATDGPLAELIVVDARGLRFRHRMLAEYVFRQHVSTADRYGISLEVVLALAPLVSLRSLRQRTYPVLILRQLMDKDAVVSMSTSIQAARNWYESLQQDFDWNGRYWEQRALLESDAGVHDKAYSYARKSINVHRHAFSLNTLGRVRLKASIDSSINPDSAWDFFLEGVASLDESVAHAQGFGDLHEHPFMTFFSYLSEFAERLQPGDARLKALDQLRMEWQRNFERLEIRSQGVLGKMHAAQEKLLRSQIARPN
ncbi:MULTISPECIES: SIR2 family protein [unclassified Lysobacter]|uniref:P-loop NTPase n=1 Tax=unclassified Lysobacter TaxID=2635362 RepID=UPI0009E81443|nr:MULTISPECIES: SIR2 family protein [unclassified Lysobacter]